MRALVAGTRGGIGAACLELLREQGWAVHGVDREEVDITQPGGAERAVAEAERELGGLDAVVHAVGMSGRRFGDGPPSGCTDDGWSEVLRVNLESAFRLLRASWPAFSRAGGGSFRRHRLGARRPRRPRLHDRRVRRQQGGAALPRALRRPRGRAGRPASASTWSSPAWSTRPWPVARSRTSRSPRRLRELQPLGGSAVGAADVAAAVAWVVSPAAGRTTGAFLARSTAAGPCGERLSRARRR